jgi:spoIIIJ-associated protein
MRSVEATGKTVEEAKRKAASQLGVPEADLEFEVLDVGSRGVLGFIGGTPARVRATYYETRRHRLESPHGAGRIAGFVEETEEEAQPRRRGRRRGGSRARDAAQQARSREQKQRPAPRQAPGGSQRKLESQPAPQGNGQRAAEQPEVSEAAPETADVQARPKRRSRGRGGRAARPAQTAAPEAGEASAKSEEKPTVQTKMEAPAMEVRAQQALEVVQRILDAAALNCSARVSEVADDGFQIDIEGENAAVLVGRQGQVLDALQFLVGVTVNRQYEGKARVTLEAAGFRQKHRETLVRTALELAEQVAEHNQEAELEPLPPRDRLIIHNALKDHPKVYTYSEGEGDNRHVVISPKTGNEQS